MDEITLDVHGTVIERLDAGTAPESPDDDTGEEEPVAGPIAIAVDVSEEAPGADNPTP